MLLRRLIKELSGKLYCSALLMLLISAQAVSHSEHKVELKSHTHGEAEINLVYEAGELAIELISPQYSLMGFEGQPHGEQQTKHYQQVLNQLKLTNTFLVLTAGECRLTSVDISNPIARLGASATHVDIEAVYTYACQSEPEYSLSEGLFERFPSLTTLRLTWVVNGQQGVTMHKKAEIHSLHISH